MQNPQDLAQRILELSPEQQEAVAAFVDSLVKVSEPRPTFRQALNQFKSEHPELLRLLAQ